MMKENMIDGQTYPCSVCQAPSCPARLHPPPLQNHCDTRNAKSIYVDAGPTGLGAILTQTSKRKRDGQLKVVSYASRSLGDVASRYSQTEREALTVFWVINIFHLCLYGASFQVVTYHKPLEAIFNKTNSHPPARIENLML